MNDCCQHQPIGGPHFRKCACGQSFWVGGSYEYHRDKCPACEVKVAFEAEVSAAARKKIAAQLQKLMRDHGVEDTSDAR